MINSPNPSVSETNHDHGATGDRTANPVARPLLHPQPAVWFYVPETFNPALFPQLAGQHEESYWLVHKIISLHITYRHDAKGWVNISRQTIREFIHPRHASRIRTTLLQAGIIESNGIYKIGRHSMGYRIGPAYRGHVKRIQVTKPSLVAKMLRHRIRFANSIIPESKLSCVHKHLLHWLRLTKIDTQRAYRLADELPEKPKKKRKIGSKGRRKMVKGYRRNLIKVTVDQIADGSIDFTVDRQGRVHTPITRLFTEARSCLTIGGQNLVSIDIANSQLLFFCLLMLDRLYLKIAEDEDAQQFPFVLSSPSGSTFSVLSSPSGSTLLPPDVADFVARVMDGSIYDYLMGEYNGAVEEEDKIKTRKQFKGDFFQQVLYGDNDRNYASLTGLAIIFQTVYPSVWAFIIDQKQWDGDGDQDDAFKKLSKRMQWKESRFMIGQVCTRLAEHHALVPVLTVHDSILTTEDHVDLVKRIISEEFTRLGVSASVRVER